MSGARVFISYSHDDSEWVRQFAQALKELNVTVWLDEWQIAAGDSLRDALEVGLRESDAIIAVLSPSNAARPNTFFELGFAIGMGKRLIPVVSRDMDRSKIPFDLKSRRYLIKGSPDETAREVAGAVKDKEANDK
jgi:predicted nucleotide-binding protein